MVGVTLRQAHDCVWTESTATTNNGGAAAAARRGGGEGRRPIFPTASLSLSDVVQLQGGLRIPSAAVRAAGAGVAFDSCDAASAAKMDNRGAVRPASAATAGRDRSLLESLSPTAAAYISARSDPQRVPSSPVVTTTGTAANPANAAHAGGGNVASGRCRAGRRRGESVLAPWHPDRIKSVSLCGLPDPLVAVPQQKIWQELEADLVVAGERRQRAGSMPNGTSDPRDTK
jgi:hypothetical protein